VRVADLNGNPETPSEPIVGDRGVTQVYRTRGLQSRMTNLLAIGLMTALGLGLLAWYYAHVFAQQSEVRKTAQTATRSRAQGEMPLPALGPIQRPSLLGPPPPLPPEPDVLVTAPASPTSTPALDVPVNPAPLPPSLPVKTAAQLTQERQLAGPALTRDDSPSRMPSTLDPAHPSATPTSSTPTVLDTLLHPTVTPTARAEALPTQRLLLPKGAFIDCTLETAIDSSLPGLTTCITAGDTFSADGTVVLLERGTKLVGETRGEVHQGSSRLFVLWTEARTPTGVVVPLASPGTDELGRAGLSGDVNRHFWERFGSAILVSIIEGAIQTVVTSHSSNGTVVVSPNTATDISTEVLKGTIAIPPTVTKANGDRIQILVARDLDFRSVYELHSIGR
jgi:type IV secretion system protein VirB10